MNLRGTGPEKELGKTGDYYLINERGDRFPMERGVTLAAMRVKALSMKWRVPGEYLVCEARTTRVVFNTIGQSALADAAPAASEIIGPGGQKGRTILRQAKDLLQRGRIP